MRRWIASHIAAHGNVNVLENLARGDGENAVAGFDEVVALAARVLTSEMIREAEAGVELFGFDEKASTVGFPLVGFHGARAPS